MGVVSAPQDPVLQRRARIARASRAGQRFGYACYLVAVIVFASGAAAGFSPLVVAAVVTVLAAGSVALAPAIVFGYAVRAADRADRADPDATRPPPVHGTATLAPEHEGE